MPRIDIPKIPDDIVNTLTTVESTLVWIKRLEGVERRLEEELSSIRAALRLVVYPTYNRLNKEQMSKETHKSPQSPSGDFCVEN